MWYEKLWGWARETVTITVPGVVVVFALTYVLVFAIQAGAAGAAWVQAFGSIGAILAAAYIAGKEGRAVRARERRKEAVVSMALLNQAEGAKATLMTQSRLFQHNYAVNGDIQSYQVERAALLLSTEMQTLRTVDLFALPDPRLVNAHLEIIRELDDARWIAGAKDLRAFIELYERDGPFEANIAHVERCIQVIRDIAGLEATD